MSKKEFYRNNLPHFQQPGQAYFVTWNLKDAVPEKALRRYSNQLRILKSQMKAEIRRSELSPLVGAADSDPLTIITQRKQHRAESLNSDAPVNKIRKEYYALRKKYIKAYNDLLDVERNPKVNLSKSENLHVLIETLQFWNGKRLENYAFCIMPNHVHWVFHVFDQDDDGEPVYLQDILYSVKRFSAIKINKLERSVGKLWQKESFDTTIRDEEHLYNAINYTLNNPVSAGLVDEWNDWPGNWCKD